MNAKTDDLTLNPALRAKRHQPGGAELIHFERLRQIDVKRRTLAHDVEINTLGQLAAAAACYATVAAAQSRTAHLEGGAPSAVALAPIKGWPWRGAAWKPSDNRLKNLVRAGALIAAEIDRLIAAGETMPEEVPAAAKVESADPRGEEGAE